MATMEFKGHVDVTSSASVSTKGGSLTTTLRKPIRETLGSIAGGHLSAAALTFGSGPAVVLLGGGAEVPCSLRVSQVAKNRYEIELTDGEDDAVDDLTAAFLTLKTQHFKDGATALRGPLSADDWRAEMNQAVRRAEAKHEG